MVIISFFNNRALCKYIMNILFVLNSCLVLEQPTLWDHSFQHTLPQVILLHDSNICNMCPCFIINLVFTKMIYSFIVILLVTTVFTKHTYLHRFLFFLMYRAGSFSRSAVNHESGAKTGLSGIVSGTIMGCALLFLTPLFEYIPQVCFNFNAFLFSVGMQLAGHVCQHVLILRDSWFEQHSLLIALSIIYYGNHGLGS